MSIMHKTFIVLAALWVFLLPVETRAQDITTDLVAHWPMDETTGTNVSDVVGSLDGTWTGSGAVDAATGQIGGALDFTGNTTYVALGNPPGLQDISPYTVSAWIYPHTLHGGTYGAYNMIFATDDDTGSGGWSIFMNASQQLRMVTDGIGMTSVSNETIPLNQWTHIAGTWDGVNGASTHLYINGVEVTYAQQSGGGLSSDATTPKAIGSFANNQTLSMDGLIDDLRLYSRELSPADIAALYNYREGAGVMRYNETHSVIEYHNGTNWIAAGPKKYVPNAVTFDGANDYLNDSLTMSDSKLLTGSFWIRINTLGGSPALMGDSTNRLNINFDGTDVLRIIAEDGSSSDALAVATSAFADNDWHHVMFSFDMADTNNRHIYVDGVSDLAAVGHYNDVALDFTAGNHVIGSDNGGADPFDGDIADWWFDPGTYIDLSDPNNRAKFYNNGPVNLGADGSGPTGAAPDIFLSGSTDDWHTNKGTGGGFTENGTLDTAATTPGSYTADCTGLGDAHYNDPASGRCYYRYEHGAGSTFAAAQAECNSNGGYLAVIESSAENDVIYDNLVNGFGIVHLGGQAPSAGGDWTWYGGDVNGTVFWNGGAGGSVQNGLYSNWEPSEPNDGSNPACLQMGFFAGGTWDDYYCNIDAGKGHICEIETPLCSNPDFSEGSITYNTDTDQMQFCNGEDWIAMGPPGDGGGGCSNPSGSAGDLTYNTTFNTMQYCEGDTWVAIGSDGVSNTLAMGLVGHWTMDDESGATIVDSLGANNGTWVDGTGNDVTEEATTGQIGGAITFDGAGDIVTVGDVHDLTGSVTLCGWANPTNSTWGYIAGKYDAGANTGYFLRANSTSAWTMGTDNVNYLRQDNSIDYDEWQHVCAVFNPAPAESTLYKNGVALVSNTTTPAHVDNAVDLTIGSRYDDDAARRFEGELDDIRLYNRALSASEVLALYEQNAPPVWSPTDLAASPILWFDATDASSISHTAGAVSTWTDKINGRVASLDGGSTDPDYSTTQFEGSLPGIYFDGNTRMLGTLASAASGDAFIFLAQDHSGTSDGSGFGQAIGLNAGSQAWNNAQSFWIGDYGGSVQSRVHSQGGSNLNMTAWSSTGDIMFGGVRSGADQLVGAFNGALTLSTQAKTIDLNGTTNSFYIGGDAFDNNYEIIGTIGEIIVLNYEPSLSERQTIEGYLAHKWGLEGKLPGAHPYKSSAP